MGNFCKFCGKPLTDGRCDCAAFIAANPVQTPPAPEVSNTDTSAQPNDPGLSFQNQAGPATESAPQMQYGNAGTVPVSPIGSQLTSIIKGGLTRPVTTGLYMSKTTDTAGLIFLGIYAAILFIMSFITVKLALGKELGRFFEKYYAPIALYVMFAAALAVVSKAVTAYVFGNKYDTARTSFVTLLTRFCTACVIPAALTIVSPIFGKLTVLIVILAIGIWTVYSDIIVAEYVNAGKSMKLWAILAGEALSYLCSFICTKVFLSNVADIFTSQIGDLLSGLIGF